MKSTTHIVLTALLKQVIIQHRIEGEDREGLYKLIESYVQQFSTQLKESPAEAILAIYELIDPRLVAIAAQATCSKGCAHCCRINVDITDAEAILITEVCRDNGIDLDYGYLEAQAKLSPFDRVFSAHRNCVFLGKEGECMIYDVRPIGCRKYYVTTDPKFCNAAEYDTGPRNYLDVMTEVIASAVFNVVEEGGMAEMLLKERDRPGEGTFSGRLMR